MTKHKATEAEQEARVPFGAANPSVKADAVTEPELKLPPTGETLHSMWRDVCSDPGFYQPLFDELGPRDRDRWHKFAKAVAANMGFAS